MSRPRLIGLQPREADQAWRISRATLALAADLRLDVSGQHGEGAARALVYFAEAVGAARVKIGVAADPEARIAGLQTACPHPLCLLGAIPGGREVEASLHCRLRDYHLGGEWFFLAKPVSAFIAHLTAPPAAGSTAQVALDRGCVGISAKPPPGSVSRLGIVETGGGVCRLCQHNAHGISLLLYLVEIYT